MPLPSVLNGAKKCQVLTKRNNQSCKNPAAYGCKACRMHGAHKSRNVLQGANHPQYKNGTETKAVRAERSNASAKLLYIRDLGDNIGMFNGTKTRGRKPNGYRKLNMDNPAQRGLALLKVASS